jgi:hypothetical protein
VLVDVAGSEGAKPPLPVPRVVGKTRLVPPGNIKPDTPVGLALTAPTQAARMALVAFEFDLRALAEDPLPPGEYLMYLVVGGMVSNPQPISLHG